MHVRYRLLVLHRSRLNQPWQFVAITLNFTGVNVRELRNYNLGLIVLSRRLDLFREKVV